jgi:hypothetical protein
VKTLARAYLIGFGGALGVVGGLGLAAFVIGRIAEHQLFSAVEAYLKAARGGEVSPEAEQG